jgi:hypothetical protein
VGRYACGVQPSQRVAAPLVGVASWSMMAVFCPRSGAANGSSTESAQPIHPRCTVLMSCPHRGEPMTGGVSLGGRAVSQTPTYDQLRGEYITAGVPARPIRPGSLAPANIAPPRTRLLLTCCGLPHPDQWGIRLRAGPGSRPGPTPLAVANTECLARPPLRRWCVSPAQKRQKEWSISAESCS